MGMLSEGEAGKGKKKRRGEEVNEHTEGTPRGIVDESADGDENSERPGKVARKRNKDRIHSANSEIEDGGEDNRSTKEDSNEGAGSSKGQKRKKQKNSGLNADSSWTDESSDLQDKMQKKNKEERKKKKDRRSKDSFPSSGRDATSEDRRHSGEGLSLNLLDDKTRKKGKKENGIESGKELTKKKKKSKLKVSEDSNAPSSRSFGGNLGSVGDDHQKQKSSSVAAGVKKSPKNREKKDRNDEKQKPTKVSDKISSKKSDAKRKRVSFSGHDEVFPSTSDEGDLVRGKRFTKEEDEMIKEAVFDYIKENNLGEDGLQKVLRSKSHLEVRGCWKEIGAAMPWRPKESIYSRAQNLFRRSEKRKWEPEELDLIRRYHEEHGAKWNEMAQILGKHRVHVKDAWRRSIKLANPKRGKWALEEYQSLFDLVNADLKLKAFEERKTKHGMLRENISWGTISEKMTTRFEMSCCMKWYNQLTSPMVAQGLWADTDDYLLIEGLLKLDACCIEDVEWDDLLEHRSGEISLRRWRQMTRHIGGAQERSFMEQVEILASRYCPSMLEYRAHTVKKSAREGDGCEV